MFNKLLVITWFLLRPTFYKYFIILIIRKFLPNRDTQKDRLKAKRWCEKNSISYLDALKFLGINGKTTGIDRKVLKKANDMESKSPVRMGSKSDINLLYDCVKILKPKFVLETGVAYGWSSLAILKAIKDNGRGKLYSIDMPYPIRGNEEYVGIVIPKELKKNWLLIRKPDNPGIDYALNIAGGKIDICHYDSDKSWWGRNFAYPILWKALAPNGLFISDDIQDNLYFSEFVKKQFLKFAVIKYKNKFIGIIRKI